MGWIKQHWQTGLGILLAALPYLGRSVRFVVDLVGYGGSIDFILARSADPGWLAKVVKFFLDPPAVLSLLCLLAGILLIFRAERRRSDALYGPQKLQIESTVHDEAPSAPDEIASDDVDLPLDLPPVEAPPQVEDDSQMLWVGKVEPFLEDVLKDDRFSIAISVVHIGDDDLFLKGISGQILVRFKSPNGSIHPAALSPLTLMQNHEMMDGFPPRHYGTLSLYQYVTHDMAERIITAAEGKLGVVLDLREVRLIFAHKSQPEKKELLRLWDAVRLKKGSFVGSLEVHLT